MVYIQHTINVTGMSHLKVKSLRASAERPIDIQSSVHLDILVFL